MASPQQAAEESHTRIEEAVRPIASFRVGDAVLADAEHGDGDTALGSQVDPATWRHLVLLCRKTDGSKADVELLRPLTWLKEQGAVSGGSVEISVPECGIEGQARVLSIDDCPPLQSTPPGYRTVTGTFHHQATAVMDVLVEGSNEPIGTTPNHPFWSEDRQDYVRADSLTIGERLLGESGPVRVKSLAPQGSPEPVYNIEVHCDHNYRVANAAVLVHNAFPCRNKHRSPNRSVSFPRAKLPPNTGGKTSGVLSAAGHRRGGGIREPLVSGVEGPSQYVRGKGLPGFNGNQLTHVEGHAAAHMRKHGIMDAVLDINKAPCTKGSGGGCEGLLPKMLPEGARLRVRGPNGYDRLFIGLAD